jgi:hypothetical protein
LSNKEEIEGYDEMWAYIDECADKDKLPLFTDQQWVKLNQTWDKDKFRRVMVDYIVENKPPFPFKEITENDVVENFFKLCKEKDNVTHPDTITSKFSYNRKYGRVVFDGKATYNKVSDYFQRTNRYECDTKHNISVMTSWKTGQGLYTILNSFWTMKHGHLSKKVWHSSFNVAASVASQFRPAIVKTVLNHFKAKTYMDMSSGWGDRLAGFYASNAEHYIGFDPSTKTFPIYHKQKEFYEKLLGYEKKATLINLPAEDVNYDELPMVDLFFSSPPYFMAERYEDHPNQSWVRYKTIEQWRNDFLYVVLEKAWGRIKDGGHMAINISDIYRGKERIHICEPMCDFIETLPNANFVGYYGMKMSLRPNTQEDDSHAEELRKMANTDVKATHIEPMWVFRKGEDRTVNNDIEDLFE